VFALCTKLTRAILRVSHAKNLSVKVPFNGTYNKTSYKMRICVISWGTGIYYTGFLKGDGGTNEKNENDNR